MKSPNKEVTLDLKNSKNWIERWKRFSSKTSRGPTFSDGMDIYLKDVDGNLYMDFATQSTNVGIKNPRIVNAVKAQLDRTGVSMIRGPYIPEVELMGNILKIVPNCLRKGTF